MSQENLTEKKVAPMELEEKGEKTELVDGKARHFDPDFKGPIKDRSCTDIPCCLIFVLYVIGMLVVGIIAFKEGDLDRLIYPKDSKGNTCGKDFADRKYLFFFDLTNCTNEIPKNDLTSLACPTPQVCVEKCPDFNAGKQLGGLPDLDKVICIDGVQKPKNRKDYNKLADENKCASYYVQSSPVLYRCLPTALGLDKINTTFKEKLDRGIKCLGAFMNTKSIGVKIFEDLKMVWYWILGGFILSMIISLLWIIVTRWVAWPMVWFSILASLVLLVVGIYFCYNKYEEQENKGVNDSIEWKLITSLDSFTNSKKFWLAAGIFLTIVFVVLFLIILVLRKRINLAIALIKEASRAVGSMISTLFFPVIPWILQLFVFAWFVAVALFLVSNGTAKYHTLDRNGMQVNYSTECNPKTHNDSMLDCVLTGYETNKHLNRMAVYHFFGWLWMMNFVIALGECVLAGAFASWYFAFHKPDDVPALPVLSALGRTLRYHTGSLAFGAAIIAIVQFIRAVLEYIDKKLKESNQDNGFVKFVMKCMKCCFWCLEKCLRFLNKNAYIGIAIYGKNFCKAAKDAFFLLLRNALRVAAVNGVTAFLLFIGKLFVVGIIGVASFFWFDRFVSDADEVQLSYSVVPIVVCVIGAWVVAAIFFSVYDMAIDTIFFCFLEDSERNDGSAEKPYYMSENLRDILGK